MIRRVLAWSGAVVLLLALLAVAAALQLEWQARRAARDGAARLAAVERSSARPGAPVTGTPVLILLHGAGLNAHMWDPVRRHLDPTLRVIALDLPGHGARRDVDYSLDGATADVLLTARSVASEPVILVGDSLGGYTAMAAAPLLPRGQLVGLVLAGSSGNIGATGAARMLAQSAFVRALTLVSAEGKLAARALDRFGVAGADAQAIVAAGVNFGAIAPAGRSLAGVDFRARLAAVDVPVLIINGSLDSNAMAQEASFLAAARQGTSLHFENCEHGVSMRRPAEFAAAMNAFAHRVTRAPGSARDASQSALSP